MLTELGTRDQFIIKELFDVDRSPEHAKLCFPLPVLYFLLAIKVFPHMF